MRTYAFILAYVNIANIPGKAHVVRVIRIFLIEYAYVFSGTHGSQAYVKNIVGLQNAYIRIYISVCKRTYAFPTLGPSFDSDKPVYNSINPGFYPINLC